MNKIYVGNLPFQTTEPDLDSEFRQFGDIKEIALIKDRYSNEFKGFAFITYATPESAQQALTLDGKDFQGRPMKVSLARSEEKGGRFSDSGRGRREGTGRPRREGGGPRGRSSSGGYSGHGRREGTGGGRGRSGGGFGGGGRGGDRHSGNR